MERRGGTSTESPIAASSAIITTRAAGLDGKDDKHDDDDASKTTFTTTEDCSSSCRSSSLKSMPAVSTTMFMSPMSTTPKKNKKKTRSSWSSPSHSSSSSSDGLDATATTTTAIMNNSSSSNKNKMKMMMMKKRMSSLSFSSSSQGGSFGGGGAANGSSGSSGTDEEEEDESLLLPLVVGVQQPRMPSTSSNESCQQVLDGISINKLNFHKLIEEQRRGHSSLYGRQDETNKIQSLWDDMWTLHNSMDRKSSRTAGAGGIRSSSSSGSSRTILPATTTKRKKQSSRNVRSNNNNKTLVVVDGKAGVGKSTLIKNVLKSTVQSSRYGHSFFAQGKFDFSPVHHQGIDHSTSNNNNNNKNTVPFDGIKMVIDDLCDQIVRGPQRQSPPPPPPSSSNITSDDRYYQQTDKDASVVLRDDEINKLLIDELHEEIPFLIGIFPKLRDVLGEDQNYYNKSSSKGQSSDDGSSSAIVVDDVVDIKANADRLIHCVRKFVQVICSYRPLVIFVDDTHWADEMSLDLLYQLLADDNNSNALMVVCSYRTDEVFVSTIDSETDDKKVEPVCPMGTFLSRVKKLDENVIKAQYMSIGSLSVDDLNSFLLDLLGTDSTPTELDETYRLAVVLHEKTDGNIFFATQVLSELHQQGFIEYNLGLMKWIFDAQEIRENAPVAPNIVQFVKEKLTRDAAARQLLPIAACLGSVFDTSMISIILSSFQIMVEMESNVDEINSLGFNLGPDFDIVDNLERCCREGYIQRFGDGISSTRFQFVHDRIQEAAFKTVPENLQHWLRHQIGTSLATGLLDDDLEDKVFTVIGLIDQAIQSSPSIEERELYLKLNMLAGEKAMSYSAFKSAARYFRAAVDLLPSDSFELQYGLAFRAYQGATEAEFCIGNFSAVSNLGDIVLSNEYVPAVDKLRITNVLMDAFVAQNNATESIARAIVGLAQCGCKFPKSSVRQGFATVTGLIRTKFSNKMQDPSSITNLPFSVDPTHTVVMKTLDKLATAAFVAGETNLLPLVILKSLNRTFQHGITIYSPAAFALVALLVTNFMDDFGAGWNYARSALIMLERLKCREIESRTIFLVNAYTAHWSRPLRDCMKAFITGYGIGLSSGDVMSAMYCMEFYCEFSLYTGMKLRLVDENCIAYGKQMREFGQMNPLLGHEMIHQLVRLLRKGEKTESGLKLSGDIMDQDKVLKQLESSGEKIFPAALHRYRITLACYLGDFEAGSQVAFNHSDNCIKLLPGHAANLYVRFCSALCCYAQYRTSHKRKLLREAKRQHEFVRRWAHRSTAHNPNAVHLEMLLSAELDAARGKSSSAYAKYKSAILMAGRIGVIQDQALSNERFASYCQQQNDVDEAKYRLKSAMALYTEWAGQLPGRFQCSSSVIQLVGEAYVSSLSDLVDNASADTSSWGLVSSPLP